VGGDAGDVQAPGVVFEEGQCVEACAEHGVEVVLAENYVRAGQTALWYSFRMLPSRCRRRTFMVARVVQGKEVTLDESEAAS